MQASGKWGFQHLRTLFFQILDFAKKDYQTRPYLHTIAFLAICCSLNYTYGFDDNFLEPKAGTFMGMVYYFLFYAFAYYGVAIPIMYMPGNKNLLSNGRFWLLSLTFLLFIGIEGGTAISYDFVHQLGFENSDYWALRTLRKLEPLVVWIPLYYLFMKWAMPEFKDGLFGIRWKAEDLKPYLSMLWVMIPLITVASFLPDFQRQYPVFKTIVPYLPSGEPWQKPAGLLIFEGSYLLSFIITELMFRGGLVLGMSNTMGRQAVLPMVGVYMFLHFGKPMGESISSVFGGYILAVLAFQNRNIWGGIFIHACVAFLMDLAAGLQLWDEIFAGF